MMMLVLEYFFISFDYLLFVVSKKQLWARALDAGFFAPAPLN